MSEPIKTGDNAIREALAQPQEEKFEYWNAVEGWVKLDEVRQHFDSVGCGTIYKTAGEDRAPLYTKPARTWVGLTMEEKKHILDTTYSSSRLDYMDAAERILKEKNS